MGGWIIRQDRKNTKFSMSRENYETCFEEVKNNFIEILRNELGDFSVSREMKVITQSKDLGDLFRNYGWNMIVSKPKLNSESINEKIGKIQGELEYLYRQAPTLEKHNIRDGLNPSINMCKALLEEINGDSSKYVYDIVETNNNYGLFNYLFPALAPFVDDGSYITIIDYEEEDTEDPVSRYLFKDGKMVEQKKQEVWG